MEPDLHARVKNLAYKVRGSSKESQAQKAVHVLDPDLRSHWSTSTNSKEWILLELEESCMLSHIRIHNKSVLEWEISIGLRFKPDTFLKVRPRCEAPRRDITYHVGYLPCRFVRISCLRGNPIAIFHIQLIGISVPGLEPEFQPVVEHLSPYIIAHIRDPQDIYLQLLQDITLRLSPFMSQLEGELAANSEAVDSAVRFFAMLVGPFYPILSVVRRENEKIVGTADVETLKSNQTSVFTVSSNFQAPPKRIRSPGHIQQPPGHTMALRPDAAILLLKVASKDSALSMLCQKVARLLSKLAGPSSTIDGVAAGDNGAVLMGTSGQPTSAVEELAVGTESSATSSPPDYSSIIGDDFKLLDEDVEIGNIGLVEVAAVEEGLLHLLYACASQPVLSRRLADTKSDLTSVLPLIQAILPALRPPSSTVGTVGQIEESFSQWQSPLVQRALLQVVALSSSPSYQPLLDACAGYLSSYSPAHEKAACVLIDLCTGPLAPWLPMVIAKVDLAIEFLEDLLGVIQGGQTSTGVARAALVYLMLGLSGHMDDMLSQYKDVKHLLLFLIEMLEPYLVPAITPVKNTIAFGDVSTVLLDKQEQSCALALDLLHTAIQKPGVLSAMEGEWRRGHAVPSVLLSILAPHVPLPPGIDLRKSTAEKWAAIHMSTNGSAADAASSAVSLQPKPSIPDEEKDALNDGLSRDSIEDGSNLFAPVELKGLSLPAIPGHFEAATAESQTMISKSTGGGKESNENERLLVDIIDAQEYSNLQAEYLQLVNTPERELRASEFIRFAKELHSRSDGHESHQAAIDAFLLAAECHLNPFFMVSPVEHQEFSKTVLQDSFKGILNGKSNSLREGPFSELVSWLEEERDKSVLRIILQAAEWDSCVPEGASATNIANLDSAQEEESQEVSSGVWVSEEDAPAQDAVTVVRQHQALLCRFLVHQLQRDRHNMYEVLLQGLLFVLESSTELASPPTDVINVILQTAERVNSALFLYHSQVREGLTPQGSSKAHSIRRQWTLLRRLVLVSSGGRFGDGKASSTVFGDIFVHKELVPAWAWVAKISEFSMSASPLVRYVGWMALSRFARLSCDIGLCLVTHVKDLSRLLLIFSDELVSMGGLRFGKVGDEVQMENLLKAANAAGPEQAHSVHQEFPDQTDQSGLVRVLYPELDAVFPNLRAQFRSFAEIILDSVCLQLKEVPCTAVPDMLTWFAHLCRDPFALAEEDANVSLGSNATLDIKGFAIANVRHIILRLLEVIVVEHTDVIVSELPKVIEVVLALSSTSYCDVNLLDSVMAALKPIISHSMARAAAVEFHSEAQVPSVTFEALCFDAILKQLKQGPNQHGRLRPRKALLFISGCILSDLSMGLRNDLLSYLLSWTDFKVQDSKESLDVYLFAFCKMLEECKFLLTGTSKTGDPLLYRSAEPGQPQAFGVFVDRSKANTLSNMSPVGLNGLEHERVTPRVYHGEAEPESSDENEAQAAVEDGGRERLGSIDDDPAKLHDKSTTSDSTSGENEFCQKVQKLVMSLAPSLEAAWKLHPQLTAKVSRMAASCLLYSSISQAHDTSESPRNEDRQRKNVGEEGLLSVDADGFVQQILSLQQSHCWQVAGVAVDYFLSSPSQRHVVEAFPTLCKVFYHQCSHAPRIGWRLQASKWLSKALLVAENTHFEATSTPLIRLLCTMLEHPEPEQRSGALQQLAKLVDDDHLSSPPEPISGTEELKDGTRSFTRKDFSQMLVASTWSQVSSAAASDPLVGLRRQALEVLLKFVPLAQAWQLQSFLTAVDRILPPLSISGHVRSSGPLTRPAIAVLAKACLYSSASAIESVSDKVWRSVQAMAEANPGGVFMESERALCQALLQLRDEGEMAKQRIRETLAGDMETKDSSLRHTPVRESVLEVLVRLNRARLEVDSYKSAAIQEAMDIEQAEIELEMAKEEQNLEEAGLYQDKHPSSGRASTSGLGSSVGKQRLKELRSQLIAIEKSSTRAEIAARRERQKLLRRERQIALEEATLRELQLLQTLERERAAEAEREIERQKMLDKEKAKTRELKYNLEIEAERRNQREFQRDLEHRELSATRSSRREYSSSTPSSRPRERYRERDREGVRQEGSSRPSNGGGGSGTTPPATPTAGGSSSAQTSTLSMSTSTLASASVSNPATLSSRAYPGQSLALLHSRDRSEDRGFDEGLDGNDGGYGDSEGGSAIDPNNLSSSQRQGSRNSRPRQVVERRERDGRREGKWERKQSKLDGLC